MLEVVYLLDITGHSLGYGVHLKIQPKMRCEQGLQDTTKSRRKIHDFMAHEVLPFRFQKIGTATPSGKAVSVHTLFDTASKPRRLVSSLAQLCKPRISQNRSRLATHRSRHVCFTCHLENPQACKKGMTLKLRN